MSTALPVEPGRTRGTILAAASALASLLLGLCVYLFGRDWDSVFFLASFATWQPGTSGAFGVLGGWLPSLLHSYGIALLIILMLRPHPRGPLFGASGWFLVAALMESLQSVPAECLILSAYRLLTEAPLPDLVEAYVVNGRFDAGDLVAVAIGCFAACAASLILEVPK